MKYIFGIGTDLVAIARIEQALERHGDAFAGRLLSDEEMREYRKRQNKAAFLAKRFAAKEAIAKALGTGIGAELGLRDMTITHGESGRPLVVLRGTGEDTRVRLGVGTVHLSISDERRYATAFAVAEGTANHRYPS